MIVATQFLPKVRTASPAKKTEKPGKSGAFRQFGGDIAGIFRLFWQKQSILRHFCPKSASYFGLQSLLFNRTALRKMI